MIKLYFSAVKILAQRPIHISAVATVPLITKRERESLAQKEPIFFFFLFYREVFGGLGWLVATLVASERVMVEQNGWRRTSIARSAR